MASGSLIDETMVLLERDVFLVIGDAAVLGSAAGGGGGALDLPNPKAGLGMVIQKC